MDGKDLQDDRAVRCGDHLPPHKYIKNTSTCGTAPKNHLLNAGRRPQTSQKALVLRPTLRPEPLRWESRVEDIGPPEISQPHVISIGKRSPRDLCLKAKPQLHSTNSKLQCWMLHAKQLLGRLGLTYIH